MATVKSIGSHSGVPFLVPAFVFLTSVVIFCLRSWLPALVRWIIIPPLVIFVIGYALSAIVFPGELQLGTRFLFAFALGLIAMTFVCLILNYSPFRVSQVSLQESFASIIVISAVACVVFSWRTRERRLLRFAKVDNVILVLLCSVAVLLPRFLMLAATWDLVLENDAGNLYYALVQAIANTHFLEDTILLHPSIGWVAPNVVFFALTEPNVLTPKMVDMVFNVMTIYVMYRIACAAFDRKTGLICVLLAATLPGFLLFAVAMKEYSLLTFWWALFIYLLYLAQDEGSKKLAAFAGVTYFMAFVTKEVTIISLPFFAIYPIALHVSKHRSELRLFWVTAIVAMSAAGILLCLRVLLYNFLAPPLEGPMAQFWYTWAATHLSNDIKSFLLVAPTIPLGLLSLFSRRVRKAIGAPLLFSSLFIGLFVGLCVFFMGATLYDRYFALAIPAATIFSSALIANVADRISKSNLLSCGSTTGLVGMSLRGIRRKVLPGSLLILLLTFNSSVVLQSFTPSVSMPHLPYPLTAYPLNLVPTARDAKDFYSYRVEGRVLTAPNDWSQALAYGLESFSVYDIDYPREWLTLYSYPNDSAVSRIFTNHAIRYLIVPVDWVTPGGYNYEIARTLTRYYGAGDPRWQYHLANSSILKAVHSTPFGTYYEVVSAVIYVDATGSVERSQDVGLDESQGFLYVNNSTGHLYMRTYVYLPGTYKIFLSVNRDWPHGMVEVEVQNQTLVPRMPESGLWDEVPVGEVVLPRGDVTIHVVIHSMGNIIRIRYLKLIRQAFGNESLGGSAIGGGREPGISGEFHDSCRCFPQPLEIGASSLTGLPTHLHRLDRNFSVS